jgi:hypothetical protein
MAILTNDPTKEAQKTETTNVIGPSSGAAASQGDSQAAQGPTSAQPMAGGAQANTAAQAASGGQNTAPARSRTSSGASSGMFQNIKKYAEANKPQAQKMASAVTQDVGQKAKSIGQAVNKQKEQYQAALNQQQSKLQEAKDFTSKTVQDIMGAGQQAPQQQTAQAQPQGEQAPAEQPQVQPEAEFSGPSEEDYLKFRDYMTGGAGQFGDVSSLNVAKEQQQAKDLQRLAGGAATAEGRRELLKQAFAKRGQYTQGMKGLDDLIVSSDADARQQLSQGVKDIAEKQGTTIEQAQREAMKQLAGYQKGKESFVGDVQKELTGGTSNIMTEAEQAANEMRQQRDELVNQLGMTEDQATKFVEDNFKGRGRDSVHEAAMTQRGAGFGKGGVTRNPAAMKYQYSTTKQVRKTYTDSKGKTRSYTKTVPTTGYTNDPEKAKKLGATENEKYDPNASTYNLAGSFKTKGLKSSQRFGRAGDVLSKNYSDDELALLGLDRKDLNFDIKSHGYTGSKTKDSWNTKAKHYSKFSTGRVRNRLNELRKLAEDKTGRDIMLEGLKREGIESTSALGDYYDQLKKAEDVTTQSSAKKQDIQKYNALQDLMYGKGLGSRELSLDSDKIGQAATNQAALDKIRQDVLDRMRTVEEDEDRYKHTTSSDYIA